ncbi:MAG: hypothetical protein ACR2G7_11455 [Acidimicrobiales bacterium]
MKGWNGGWDETEDTRARVDLDHESTWTVEAELERIHRQHITFVQDSAAKETRESQLLASMMPASAVLADMFREIERRTRQVRSHRLHEVTVFLRQPGPDCIRAALRWGRKFALTDGDRQLMKSYQTRRRRLQRYPDVVVAHEFYELSGTLNGTTEVLELGTGETFPIPHFVANPAIVLPSLEMSLAAPRLQAQRHLRARNYEADPPG